MVNAETRAVVEGKGFDSGVSLVEPLAQEVGGTLANLFEQREQARLEARRRSGPERLLPLAGLVQAYAGAGHLHRARRLQRYILRRAPGVVALRRDYVALALSSGWSGLALANLPGEDERGADADWRPLEIALAEQLLATGQARRAYGVIHAVLRSGDRSWAVLVLAVWSAAEVARLDETLNVVFEQPADLETAQGLTGAYAFIRMCSAFGKEADAVRWIWRDGQTAGAAWAWPYLKRACLDQPSPAQPTEPAALAWDAVRACIRGPEASDGLIDRVHVVGDFANAVGGAEEHAIRLAGLLADHAAVSLWAVGAPHPAHAARGVVGIDHARSLFPQGGMIVFVGGWQEPAAWFDDARPERVSIFYCSFDAPRLFALIGALNQATGTLVEVTYASAMMRDEVELPGEIELTPLSLPPWPEGEPHARDDAFVVGRLSREGLEKHHPEDPEVYAALLASGASVRVRGGLCLAARLPGHERLTLLPAEVGATPGLLASLDAFFYRTGAWVEPCATVIFEAMAAGLPVVLGRRGGHAEFVRDGVDGFLVASSQEALDRLKALHADPALRVRMSRAARSRAEALFGEDRREGIRRHYLGPTQVAEPSPR